MCISCCARCVSLSLIHISLENLSFELGKDASFFLKGTARNGKQGKKLIAKVQPDLLFLDVEPVSYTHLIGSAITTVIDFVCGYPLFILLIGGGLFLFFYSGAVSLRRIGYSIKALRYKAEVAGEGQISSFQALISCLLYTSSARVA